MKKAIMMLAAALLGTAGVWAEGDPELAVIVKDKADAELTYVILADSPVLTFETVDEVRNLVLTSAQVTGKWPAADVYVTIDKRTGAQVQEALAANGLTISYPALNLVQVDSRGVASPLVLADMRGTVLWRGAVLADESVTLDLSSYPAGIYILAAKNQSFKLLKN